MADQVVTTAAVKTRLDIDVADVGDDALISSLIDQVTDWLQELTGRKLVPEAGATYVVDTQAGSVIHVKRGIRVVTTLSIASSDQPDDGSGTYTAVAAADILLRPSTAERKPGWPATQILLRGSSGRLVTAFNGARILGDFGFASTPPSLAAVALDAVATAYTNRKAGSSGAIGADAAAAVEWARYFGEGTAQLKTVLRYRAGGSMGIA